MAISLPKRESSLNLQNCTVAWLGPGYTKDTSDVCD